MLWGLDSPWKGLCCRLKFTLRWTWVVAGKSLKPSPVRFELALLERTGEGAIGFDGVAPTVSVCETCLAIDFDDVVFDFNWGSLSFMDEMINDLLSNLAVAIEEPVENLLSAQIRSLVPDLLGVCSVVSIWEQGLIFLSLLG